jgi:hypothetical protein
MAKSTAGLDAAALRRVASCDRLVKVDPDWAGKPAPERERNR